MLRWSLVLPGSAVATLLDSRWVRAVATIAAPPCCLSAVHQYVLPCRGLLQGIYWRCVLQPIAKWAATAHSLHRIGSWLSYGWLPHVGDDGRNQSGPAGKPTLSCNAMPLVLVVASQEQGTLLR